MDLTPKLTEFIRQRPTEPQTVFLLSNAKEALFGGAAGGGKSSALLAAALQYVDVPGYSAILFRRTYADLSKPGALMDRANDWLRPTAARWNEVKKVWRFPSGATLSFGHLDHEDDKYDYQGSEFQFIGFDELTHFTRTQYAYLFSRLRRLKGSKIPLRMRAASNPGGIGHEWVFDRFFTNRKQRVFIPAKLADNPHLDQVEYRTALAELDPVTRRQLEHGDWNVRQAGEMFHRDWFKVIDRVPPNAKPRWVRFWDLATTKKAAGNDPDWCVGGLVGEWGGDYYVKHVRRGRWGPAGTEAEITSTAETDGREVEVHITQEPGSSGILFINHLARDPLKGFAVYGFRETGDKVTRAKPASAAAEHGRIFLVRGEWNSDFLDVVEVFPDGAHDDDVDMLSGAVTVLTGGDTGKIPSAPTPATSLTGLFNSPM